ncbi:MAG: DUF3611 family protein [Sphingobacteriia bacterium]|nr:DUF3611 family protein [Sphingobacteriia bacterium]NCC38513.1 DUF3611 family protein [Gammaproteobacteria bacterium]
MNTDHRTSLLQKLLDNLRSSKREGLASALTRLGWIGFWLQILLGALPVVLMAYLFLFSGSLSGPRTGLPKVELLSLLNLLVLAFTIFWFNRYTVIGRRLASAPAQTMDDQVFSTIWVGLLASTLGILFTMTVLLLDVGHLLMYFLSAPQAGIPTVQAMSGTEGSWVSAVDLMSIQALLLVLAAEVIALILSLWLMFRASRV